MNSRNDTEILLRGAGFSAGIRPASAFPDRFLALRALWTRKSQRSQSGQVVGCHRQCEQLIDFLQPPHHHLSNWPDLLTPAEALFNAFPFALAQRIAGVSRCPAVDGTSARSPGITCDVRRYIVFTASLHKSTCVVRLVRTHRNPHARTRYIP